MALYICHMNIHTMKCYPAIENNEVLLFVTTWMNSEGIKLSEINERQIVYDITYMGNLKNRTNLWIKQKKQTHRYREQTSGHQWGEGNGVMRDIIRVGEEKMAIMGLYEILCVKLENC